jgi:muramoyltetrapeptide carboxypeptidase
MFSRRNFLHASLLSGLTFTSSFARNTDSLKSIIPSALKAGDTIGLVCPAHPLLSQTDLDIARETLQALGFNVKVGKYIGNRYGYLAGNDKDRADDLLEMFKDTSVNGILAIHGGWGSARILPYLDFDVIKNNPKVIIGYSDITALLNAIYAKTGLVTFHGPVASSTWNAFTVDHFKQLLINAENPTLQNPSKIGDSLVQTQDRIQTLTPGKAKGVLVGGNLTVLSAMIGSPFLPDFKGKILFLEDVGEAVYRIDRMLTHLKIAGILNQISGFVWGKCTKCDPSEGYGSLTFDQIFEDHIKPLGIPAFAGAMIGHITDKFTIPIGAEAEIDATLGSIKISKPAVSK